MSSTRRPSAAPGRSAATTSGGSPSGARADLAIVNLRNLRIGPYHDPIRALVNCAVADDVETVLIDGQIVKRDGHLTTVDEDDLLRRVQAAADRIWEAVPTWHLGKTVDEYSTPTFDWLEAP